MKKQKEKFDFAINIQGDEPFIDPNQIDLLCSSITDQTELATLIQKIATLDQLNSPGEAKVVINKDKEAIYFSRHAIPYIRGKEQTEWLVDHTFYKHIGIYAYRTRILAEITALKQSSLELSESLEQLRWIENGYKIKVEITDFESVAIDVPDDLKKLTKFL